MSKSTRLTIPATLKTSLCEYVQSSKHKQHITGKQIQEWAFKQFGYVLPQSTISTVLGAHGISIKRDGGRGRPPIRNKNLTNPNNSISNNSNNNNKNSSNSSSDDSNDNTASNSGIFNNNSNINNSSASTKRVTKRSTANNRKGSGSKSTSASVPPLSSPSGSDNPPETTSAFYQQELILLDAILHFLQTSMLQITSGFVNSLISTYGLDLQLLRSKYFLITTLYKYFDSPYNYRDLILKLSSKYPVLLSAPYILHKENSQNFTHLNNSSVSDLTNLSDPVASCKQNDLQLDSSLVSNQLLDYWPDTSFGLQPQFYNPLQSGPLPPPPASQMQPVQSNSISPNVTSFSNLQNLQHPSYTGIPLDQQPKSYLHLHPTPPSTIFQENHSLNNNNLLLQTPVHGSSNLLNSLDSNRNIM